MKFKIVMEVEGGPDLEKDLKRGHVESGIASDVFNEGGEVITSFTYEKIEE
jgi:hypothetical protein